MKVFRVQVIPTFVSLANLLFGTASIIYVTRVAALGITNPKGVNALYIAAMCICFAMVADLLDGKIARMTGGDSEFGAEIDSLSDIVSFGIAPAVMIKVMAEQTGYLARTSWVLAAAYAAFAAMRLARYNAAKNVQSDERFAGLPSPAAAGAIVSLVMLQTRMMLEPDRFEWLCSRGGTEWCAQAIGWILPLYTLVVGVLMVTKVNYSHLGRKVLSGRKPFPHLVIVALLCIFAALQLELPLAAGFPSSLFAGLALDLVGALSGKPSKADKAPAEPDAEPAADGKGR